MRCHLTACRGAPPPPHPPTPPVGTQPLIDHAARPLEASRAAAELLLPHESGGVSLGHGLEEEAGGDQDGGQEGPAAGPEGAPVHALLASRGGHIVGGAAAQGSRVGRVVC